MNGLRDELAEELAGPRLGRNWVARIKACEHMVDILLPIITEHLAESFREGYIAGQHNEHEFRPGRQMASSYRQHAEREINDE